MVDIDFISGGNVVLIDGSNLLLRIFFSQKKQATLLSPPELVKSCSEIFLHQLGLFISKFGCDRSYVFFDLGGSLRKKSILESYKANRDHQAVSNTSTVAFRSPDEDDTYSLLRNACCTLLRELNIPVYMEYGIEADDAIAVAAEELSKLNQHVVIISGDSDFLQLCIHRNIHIYMPIKKLLVNYENFFKISSELSHSKGVSLTPREYVFYKSVVGDSTDNISGIPRIGFKTLNKKLTEYLSDADEGLKNLYGSDLKAFLRELAKRNSKPLEVLFNTHLDILERNFKLIELTSAQVSSKTLVTVLDKIKEKSSRPSKKVFMAAYKTLFSDFPSLQLVDDIFFRFKKLYA